MEVILLMKYNSKEITVNIKDFKTLKVYQKSLELVREIYKLTKQLPQEERYRLTDQMIRASTSIGANIAEGVGQEYRAKTLSFCNIAMGSCSEMRHWIEIAKIQEYINNEVFNEINNILDEIARMLIGYIKMIKRQLEKE